MSSFETLPGWARLLRVARDLIRQVNSSEQIIDLWTFGGGTAMMLQIDHRESRDIDIFLSDPQALSFLDPQKRDFSFDIVPDGYGGDGTGFIKISFKNVGEIDFIVGQSKTTRPTIQKVIEDEKVLLETVPEIIAKKIFYRAASIKPRDIFDIAAATRSYSDSLIFELRAFKDSVEKALTTIEGLNPEFVNSAISELMIKPAFADVANTAIERAKQILRAV